MIDLRIDKEFQSLIPPLKPEERSGLEADIKTDGCLDPLKVWNGVIIDGHNRYDICKKNEIAFTTTDLSFNSRDDAIIWIIRNQFHRHNLNAYQQSVLALILKPLLSKKAKKNQSRSKGRGKKGLENSTDLIDTREEVAKAAGVSSNTIAKVEKIEKEATPEQKEKLVSGEVSINHVAKQIRKKERREEIIRQAQASELDPDAKHKVI